jgi:hypothetical protein
MYSRKFGLRLRGKLGNLLKTADVTDGETIVADWVICGTVIRSRFYLNESSFRLKAETSRLAACAPRAVNSEKVSVTATAETIFFSERRTRLRKTTPKVFASRRRGRLSAGSFGCGDDLVEARITAQRIPARIEAQIAVGYASRDRRDSFKLLER